MLEEGGLPSVMAAGVAESTIPHGLPNPRPHGRSASGGIACPNGRRSRGLAGGESLRAISRRLQRSPSTISRENYANLEVVFVDDRPGVDRCNPCVLDAILRQDALERSQAFEHVAGVDFLNHVTAPMELPSS